MWTGEIRLAGFDQLLEGAKVLRQMRTAAGGRA
jgi:hypothetical protein